jgi:tetratricopeptide (TPR) repeat protein
LCVGCISSCPGSAHAPHNKPGLQVLYPQDGTIFPPEMPPVRFRWDDDARGVDTWLVKISFSDAGGPLESSTNTKHWLPSEELWEQTKQRSVDAPARITISGTRSARPGQVLSSAALSFITSRDRIGDSVFYREVSLPFADAVKDPTRIRWRFGSVASQTRPPVILENLPVCGNCHSFSRDGRIMGMDVDYANDKGSYVITETSRTITLRTKNIITWADYKREESKSTFGLLSSVSPDGRYVLSTVKDRSVFVPKSDLFYSQLFFPVQGIIAVYDRSNKTFFALPGADDRSLVQSNGIWTPDGKCVVFARAKAHHLKSDGDPRGSVLTSEEECAEFLKGGQLFKFDLYRVPFNDGKGGQPEPVPGASHNGMSNYFPRFSPDGKWLVFCKAESFMLLQPDSALYIMPAQGGEPRRMRCNTARMNSWHSWSSNSRWLVFSSKANSAYTQLFLTHVDENGQDSPPVLLENLTGPDRAANIPEFVSLNPEDIQKIQQKFVDDVSYVRAGREYEHAGDLAGAAKQYETAIRLNPNNAYAYSSLAGIRARMGKSDEALGYYRKALESQSHGLDAAKNLTRVGMIEMERARYAEAEAAFNAALALTTNKIAIADVHTNLGALYFAVGRIELAEDHFRQALAIDPNSAAAHCLLGVSLMSRGARAEAKVQLEAALRASPRLMDAHASLGLLLIYDGDYPGALHHLRAVLAREPEHATANSNMGFWFANQGRLAESLPYFRIAIEQKPDYAEAHYNLGIALARMGRTDEAIRQLRKGLDVVPGYAGFYAALASIYASRANAAESIRHYEQAVRLSPDNAQWHNDLGAQLMRVDRVDEAMAQFSRALELQPSLDAARSNLAAARARQTHR